MKKTREGSSVCVLMQQKWMGWPGSVGITRQRKLQIEWNSQHKQITSRALQSLFEPFLTPFIFGLDGAKMPGFHGPEEEIYSQQKYVQLPSISNQINRSKNKSDTFTLKSIVLTKLGLELYAAEKLQAPAYSISCHKFCLRLGWLQEKNAGKPCEAPSCNFSEFSASIRLADGWYSCTYCKYK